LPINQDSYDQIRQELAKTNTLLVAVSKTKPIEDILELYHLGHRDFGENYVSELVEKYGQLPKDIRWHFIGHLQSNKVKLILPFIHLIHGVDTEKLLREIDKQANKIKRVVDCLLQVHIAREETKFGLNENELEQLQPSVSTTYPNVHILGLMGMASFSIDMNLVRSEFKILRSLYERYPSFTVLSMGMSGDYKIAVDEGSNMVRIGSLIFGSR
jgi:PLP dependent protein